MPIPAIGSSSQTRIARLGAGPELTAEQVGGKGASLDRLMRLGQAVPQAFCVTADAFREQLGAVAHGDRHLVSALLAALPEETARAELIARFDATPTVPVLRAAIDTAVAELVDDLDRRIGAADGEERAFAVRSSALDEDGAAASFAGLHDTELGRIAGEVEPAIRRCWASLWSSPAIAYRARRGIAFEKLAMAVVVQALVPAEASAVLFTRHPVTGRNDRILMTAIRGLGEPMVSGQATPDTIVVDRATRLILERDPGRPGLRQFVSNGRIVERADARTDPALGDDDIGEIVDIALAVEASAGHPVDIEAAHADGRWFLLQSRPITSG
jgi:rifampicin phosphotransferase